ncbi:redoxin domain-containing protein [Tellurirhabdus rosea]|uniref:redoxin domain-containing protein n=1 Tax=Tellurirhabdus rosea TaxID=2674997 RepID=UPI002250598C|nr:TlpA family protein disulfide reductase [Tellurirhabdus rosea]
MRVSFQPIRLTILLLLACTGLLSAQPSDNHLVQARLKGLGGKTAYLAHYFGSSQYIPRDTAVADASGLLVFDGAKKLPEGLYMVVVDSRPLLELVIGEQNFSLEADTTDIVGSLKVTGSKENALFYEYQKTLKTKFDAMNAASRQPDGKARIAALQKEVAAFRNQFIEKNKGSLTIKYLQASAEPEVPVAPKLANGRPDSTFVFNYYKKHFFDGFDFSDERLLRSPFLQRKLDRYLKDLTVQTVDSITKEADYLVGKAKANKEVLSYTIWYITNQFEQSKVLGLDGVFVHMAEKYYLTGVMPLSDTSSLSGIRERAQTLKPLLAGKVLPNMQAQDASGRFVPLHGLKGAYTVVFFYDPDCGHCKESAPKLKQFFEQNKAKGVQVYAVAVANTPEKWQEFIKTQSFQGMTNVYGPSAGLDYKKKYDVYSTPTVYLLDKDKKILARRLPVEDLQGYFEFMQKRL